MMRRQKQVFAFNNVLISNFSVWFLNDILYPLLISDRRNLEEKRLGEKNSKLHREVQKLKSLLEKQKRNVDKLRKKLKRRESKNQQVSDSPASKTRRQLQNASVSPEVCRSLLAHNALMANIKDTFTSTKKRADRQVMFKLVTGSILNMDCKEKSPKHSTSPERGRCFVFVRVK